MLGDAITDTNTKTLWGDKNSFCQDNEIATFAHEQKCQFVLNRHDSRCTFSLQITGYVYRCSNKHCSHERLKRNQLSRYFLTFSADQSKLGSWKCAKHFLKYFPTFRQKPQRADVREPTEGCLRNRHSCNKGVIKLWASLVRALRSTADVKASLTPEESFITRVELQYMITSPCFSWPSLLPKLLIDPPPFQHIAACTPRPLPLLSFVQTVCPLCPSQPQTSAEPHRQRDLASFEMLLNISHQLSYLSASSMKTWSTDTIKTPKSINGSFSSALIRCSRKWFRS